MTVPGNLRIFGLILKEGPDQDLQDVRLERSFRSYVAKKVAHILSGIDIRFRHYHWGIQDPRKSEILTRV